MEHSPEARKLTAKWTVNKCTLCGYVSYSSEKFKECLVDGEAQDVCLGCMDRFEGERLATLIAERGGELYPHNYEERGE
jgi:hypothetical protein